MDHSQKPSYRHWKLWQLLSGSPDGLTLKEIAERLNVSSRTINRDLALLQDLGLPIRESIGEHGVKFWSFDDPEPLRFEYDEVAALYVGRRFLQPLTQTFLWDAADSALKKIRNRLGSRTVRYLDRLLDAFQNTMFGWSDYENKSGIFDALMLGCEEHREVSISYRSLEAEEDEHYAIHPYELIFHEGTVYVIGFSCKSDGLRHWKIDRMSSALTTLRKFEVPEDFDSDEYRKRRFAVYAPKDVPNETIRVLFDRRVARYVTEHRWHETEKFSKQEDGSVVAEFELSETEEFKRWLLSFGMHAEVLAPEILKKDLRAEIDGMAKRYGK